MNSIKTIKEEIKWCNKNREKSWKSKEYQDGFIDGLKQAIFLIESENLVKEQLK